MDQLGALTEGGKSFGGQVFLYRSYEYLVDPALDADNVGSLGPGKRLEGLLLLQVPAQGPDPSLEHHQY